MILIKLEITNNVNYNTFVYMKLCKTVNEKEDFIKEKEAERDKWNNDPTIGTYRTYTFYNWVGESLKNIVIEDLKELKMSEFVELITYLQNLNKENIDE